MLPRRLLLAALWVLAMIFLQIDPLHLEGRQWALFALFLLVSVASSLRPLQPASGPALDMSSAMVLAALIALGTGPGMVLAGIAALLSQVRLKQPPVEVMYAVSARIVAAGAAGLALPVRLERLPDVLRLGAGLGLYFLLSTGLETARLALARQRRLIDLWLDFFAETGLPILALAIVGALAGYLLQASPWGLGVLLAGMVMVTLVVTEAARPRPPLEERARQGDGAPPGDRIAVGALELDGSTFTVDVRGLRERVPLTPVEFQLLRYLLTHAGQVLSTQTLLQEVWDYPPGVGSPDLVRAHVKNLRAKLEARPSEPRYILTVFPHGYRVPPADEQTRSG